MKPSGSRNKIVCSNTKRNERLLAACPSFHSYSAPWWLPGPHVHTIFSMTARRDPCLTYTRTTLDVPPAGHVTLDWRGEVDAATGLPNLQQGSPVLIVMHGLTGGSEERYVQWMVRSAEESIPGIRCVVMNARGCSTSTLSSPRCFSAAWTDDIRATVKHVRAMVGSSAHVFAVGYSLGAGILAKFVCEDAGESGLTAAVACCASLDLSLSARLLERPLHRATYNRVLAGNLKRFFARHEHHFKDVDWMDAAAVRSAATVRAFDAAAIVPMFGYDDVEAYYEDASAAHLLHGARISLLLLNAIDDPICAVEGIPEEKVLKNSNVISVQTREGGHVGWAQAAAASSSASLSTSWWPGSGGFEASRCRSWENVAVCEFIAAVIDLQSSAGKLVEHTDSNASFVT